MLLPRFGKRRADRCRPRGRHPFCLGLFGCCRRDLLSRLSLGRLGRSSGLGRRSSLGRSSGFCDCTGLRCGQHF